MPVPNQLSVHNTHGMGYAKSLFRNCCAHLWRCQPQPALVMDSEFTSSCRHMHYSHDSIRVDSELFSVVISTSYNYSSVSDRHQKYTICYHSMQKGLGLGLGWRSDSVVFPVINATWK